MLENGKETCSCKWKNCPRYGDCMACMEHHQTKKKGVPYCKRRKKKPSPETEVK